jgi:hypothetical protein
MVYPEEATAGTLAAWSESREPTEESPTQGKVGLSAPTGPRLTLPVSPQPTSPQPDLNSFSKRKRPPGGIRHQQQPRRRRRRRELCREVETLLGALKVRLGDQQA